MVLTVRVVEMGSKHSRRRVLGVTAGAGGGPPPAGWGFFAEPAPEQPDALQPALDEALALAAALDQASLAQPGLAERLTPLAADHRAHVAELARVIGRPVSSPRASALSAPSAGDPAAVLAGLRTATRAAQRTAVTACRQAPA